MIAPGRIENAPAAPAPLTEHHKVIAIPMENGRALKVGQGGPLATAGGKGKPKGLPKVDKGSEGLASPCAPGKGPQRGQIAAIALGPGQHEHAT